QKLAQCYVARGWFNEALKIYENIIKSNLENFHLLLGYGNVLFNLQDDKRAGDVFSRLTRLKPHRIEGWNNLGIVKLRCGELEEAGAAFEKVLEIEPENCGALLNLGNYYFQKSNYEKAGLYFQRAIDTQPDFCDAWFNLGNVALEQGDLNKARDAFQKALHYKRDFFSALKNLGFVCEKMDNVSEALGFYKRAAQLNKADWAIQVNIANIQLKLKRYEDARACFLKAVRLSPKQTSGWLGLRQIALLRGDITTYLRSTMAILSRLDDRTIAESIDLLRELGHEKDARELLKRMDQSSRMGNELEALRLVLFQKKGATQTRIGSIYKKLASLSTPSDLVSKCLAEYAYTAGSYERALNYIDTIEDRSVKTMLIMWRSLFRVGRQREAQQGALQYTSLNPQCFECWMFLAETSAELGKDSEAREYLLKSLRCGFSDIQSIKSNPFLSRVMRTLEKSGTINLKN
ncbi:tetratricopeptide repeat protein, partial [Chitinispirillales bacterium ANBcel5]|uniref:tetratricopeptide repeat protein n=1 Tax=Cellulosispirillum alkaliphilum TaxID=3039283 RepID=UPI002A55A7B2|nr:tetratricopeptide repeat protein [Chitinispirillales bacterium ANBcel5]